MKRVSVFCGSRNGAKPGYTAAAHALGLALLERKIDELRAFEREYRSRLKSYLEGQLRELEAKAAVVPNRGPQAAASVGASQTPYSGPLPTRGAYAADQAAEPAPQYPFGGQS